ncbi:AraC family transcriptional regulator [Marivirga lumbricoides]|uniref:AraC family transcriptional regulator n=1 Tax=Marivirga lumbricoides TaxID=1046115 RepID=A0ABQ1MCJ4_9BACT|nr:AraC family transcriptional regulator [Marivirga lumbricoides]
MPEEIFKIKSLTQLHEVLGYEKPKHPLISVIEVSKMQIPKELLNMRMSANLYLISMKGSHCGIQYGRNYYDFEEGVLVFTAPHQVVAATTEIEDESEAGWMLFFHPDIIKGSSLDENISNFHFFDYESHEALHLSDQEKNTLNNCIDNIKNEYNERIDNHSQKVIVSSLELLLNYCSRFYERQFNTRAIQNKDIVTKIENFLNTYYEKGQLAEFGSPSIKYIADQVNLSPNYLSDLLRKETGRSAKDHVNDFLVNKAKSILLSTNNSVSEVAYTLGFNYPHYFSRLFKTKTGLTPQEYRELN